MNKNNIFQTEISLYNGVRDTTGSICLLEDFLSSKTYIDKILLMRAETNAEQRRHMKLSLPQATISGVFFPNRRSEYMQKHSGFICVDIDKKDNQHIANFSDLKHELSKLPEMAYISVSVSGNGYFCIIPLKYPQWHKKQFKQLEKDLLGYGIIIDKACGDVTRLRCISFDENPYINRDAVPYSGCYVDPVPKFITNYKASNEINKIYALCRIIESRKIDITSTYDNWIRVGAALSTLGESGREAFHICSKQNDNYCFTETDRKFNNLMRTTSEITLGTFFQLCKNNFITI